MKLGVKLLSNTAKLPTRANKEDAGLDVYASESKLVYQGHTQTIPTGISLDIPKDTAILVLPRSGLSAKTGLRIANAPGLIDSGYTGELQLIVDNRGSTPIEITQGDKIAQLVHVPYFASTVEEVSQIMEKDTRGKKGLGSSGK